MNDNKPEEFKSMQPDVILDDFPKALVAIHYTLYMKDECSIGATKNKLGWLAQLESWFTHIGLRVVAKWEYTFKGTQEGYAIKLKIRNMKSE